MKFFAITLFCLLASISNAQDTGLVSNTPGVTPPQPPVSISETKVDISRDIHTVSAEKMKSYFPLFVANAARIHPEMKLLDCSNGREYQAPGKAGNLTIGAQCSVDYAGKTTDILACTDKILGRFEYEMPSTNDKRADITDLMFNSCYGN